MKKKVAVFANGWSNEYLKLVLEGIKKRAKESNVDIYIFMNYSSGDENSPDNIGEKSIFALPDISRFDGVVLLANTINLNSERTYLDLEVLKHKIPAVSLEYGLSGMPCLFTDTYSGVYDLTMHLINKHGVRDVLYFSGPEDNIENQLRMQAVEDALATVGEKLDKNKICMANWSYYDSYNVMLNWMKENTVLPDAVVCANDEMAIGVCTALDRLGIKIPEQVLVTGCDCISKSQELYPILSTVAREWDKLGYEGLDMVLRQMEGLKVPLKREYKSVHVIGESCGCVVEDNRKDKRRKSIIGNYDAQRQSSINEWHLRHIDDMMAGITNATDLRNHLGWDFEYNHTFEGANFLICVVDKYFMDETDISSEAYNSYTELMEDYVHIENGESKPGEMFYVRDLLPKLDFSEEEAHTYVFMPLHVQERVLGYVVFMDELNNVYDHTTYTWLRHISQNLERVKQNIRMEELNRKLTEISVTDSLTGLKNRTGYDTLAFPYLRRCQQEGKLGSMIFADINRMKLINDKYGHLQGDYAICTVADAIKLTMPEGWIAVRYGGDEFIMVGECQSVEQAEQIKKQLYLNLEKLKEDRKLSFPLTASFGAVVMDPKENYSLEEYLRKADEAMYAMKQIAHAEEIKMI